MKLENSTTIPYTNYGQFGKQEIMLSLQVPICCVQRMCLSCMEQQTSPSRIQSAIISEDTIIYINWRLPKMGSVKANVDATVRWGYIAIILEISSVDQEKCFDLILLFVKKCMLV